MTTHWRSQAVRFLAAGAINTAVTYAIYLALLPVLDYTVAYTVAYIAGIAIAYVLSTSFVFRVTRTVATMAAFPIVYAVQYLLGVLVLNVAVRWLDVSRQLALLASIAVTVPVTFLLSRAVLMPRAEKPTA